jgi:hypothetical protein
LTKQIRTETDTCEYYKTQLEKCNKIVNDLHNELIAEKSKCDSLKKKYENLEKSTTGIDDSALLDCRKELNESNKKCDYLEDSLKLETLKFNNLRKDYDTNIGVIKHHNDTITSLESEKSKLQNIIDESDETNTKLKTELKNKVDNIILLKSELQNVLDTNKVLRSKKNSDQKLIDTPIPNEKKSAIQIPPGFVPQKELDEANERIQKILQNVHMPGVWPHTESTTPQVINDETMKVFLTCKTCSGNILKKIPEINRNEILLNICNFLEIPPDGKIGRLSSDIICSAIATECFKMFERESFSAQGNSGINTTIEDINKSIEAKRAKRNGFRAEFDHIDKMGASNAWENTLNLNNGVTPN